MQKYWVINIFRFCFFTVWVFVWEECWSENSRDASQKLQKHKQQKKHQKDMMHNVHFSQTDRQTDRQKKHNFLFLYQLFHSTSQLCVCVFGSQTTTEQQWANMNGWQKSCSKFCLGSIVKANERQRWEAKRATHKRRDVKEQTAAKDSGQWILLMVS